MNYGQAICSAFEFLMEEYPEVFVIGQGVWSPWYVGNSMVGLDKKFGTHRVIDTPVSESACTGAAVGASLAGMRPVVVHPRMDFTLYAMDAIVNEAAKWSHMTGGQAKVPLTIRAIINRGGEQGAQHSQALHAWFAHIPGLRVVMPSTVRDARDLLVASVLCNDPVIYIDDRWLYEQEEDLPEIDLLDLQEIGPQILKEGKDLTLVSSGFLTKVATDVAREQSKRNKSIEIIDLRVLSPFDPTLIIRSVEKTGRLLVVDGGWSTCGFSAEVIASVSEHLRPSVYHCRPRRVALPAAPAPTSRVLEKLYYPDFNQLMSVSADMLS